MSELSDADRATARSRTWGLLGRLLVEGPVDEVMAWVQAIPSLADALQATDADARAAEHATLFGLTLSPHASVFLSDEGLLGGDIAAQVRADLDRIGFRGTVRGCEPDHAGMICLGAAHLAEAEAEARQDGEEDVVAGLVDLQAEWIGRHLLSWWPAFAVAVEQDGSTFYGTVVTLALELAATYEATTSVTVPGPGALLDDPKTGLRDVASALAVPARSGWWLSAQRLGAIARSVGVPHGFGRRAQRLQALLGGGAEQERLPRVVEALLEEAHTWDAAYRRLQALGVDVRPWREALGNTEAMLARLGAASETLARIDRGP